MRAASSGCLFLLTSNPLAQVSPEDRRESKWMLRTSQFGRDWEFSWAARMLTPVKQQKIHWRSVPVGLLDFLICHWAVLGLALAFAISFLI